MTRPTPEEVRARLASDAPDGPRARLAALAVDGLLDERVARLLPPAPLARAALALLEGWLASGEAVEVLRAQVERVAARMEGEERTLGALLPPELRSALLELAARTRAPAREVVLSVLDRPPPREVVRRLLIDVVSDFASRLSAPVSESVFARGLSGLARMAAETAKASSGPLGSLAEGVVSAVTGEARRQAERRAADFVDSALSGAMQELATQLSDGHRAKAQAELRTALLEGVLELSLPALAGELRRLDVAGSAEALRRALRAYVTSGRAREEVERALAEVLSVAGDQTLGEILEPLGLVPSFRKLASEALCERFRQVVPTSAFARWLDELLRGDLGPEDA